MRVTVPGALGVLAAALCLAAGSASALAQAGGEPALPGEWVSGRPPAEVFAAARETLLGLGFKLAREDARSGILMTRRRDYDAEWPDGALIDLRATQTPDAATLHVRVAAGFHPARLIVGAVVETATVFVPFKLPIARGRQTMYRQEGFAHFVAGRIADRLGERFAPLSADADERMRQSPPTAEVAAACAAVTPPMKAVGVASPTLLQEVKPQYPPTELLRQQSGTVRLRAEVTEHGTLTGIQRIGGAEERNLVAAAIGAAGLWRFAPASKQGCPIRATVALEMSFVLAR